MSFKRFTPAKRIDKTVNSTEFAQALLNHSNENKKIKSAQKETKYGLEFDSRLELYMYEQLTAAEIRFKFKPVYILQEGFRYRGEAIHPITLTTDFELLDYDIIIDPKGFANDTAPLKNKMLKAHLFSLGRQPRIIFPSSQVKCREIIYRIKNGFYLDPNDPKQKLSDNQLKDRMKRLKKIMLFDGTMFHHPHIGETVLLDDIRILERWDFELLVQKLTSIASTLNPL